jgi:flagellar L-ring protein precursor FlgH
MTRGLIPILAACALAGCSTAERLSEIGRTPDLAPIENPTRRDDYQPVTMPMPIPEPEIYPANSLWRQGARSFFKDQRARRVGDVLTVAVTIKDEATLENETARSRDNGEAFGASSFFGVQNNFDTWFAGDVDPGNLVDLDSQSSNLGRGSVARTEEITLNVAAVVIQVLPNGNLVIHGRQEVRVNFEVRELYVAGVVRPEDIRPGNTISHDQIAELRVAYGGRGQLTDVQQPRYGAQVLDIILPF